MFNYRVLAQNLLRLLQNKWYISMLYSKIQNSEFRNTSGSKGFERIVCLYM